MPSEVYDGFVEVMQDIVMMQMILVSARHMMHFYHESGIILPCSPSEDDIVPWESQTAPAA